MRESIHDLAAVRQAIAAIERRSPLPGAGVPRFATGCAPVDTALGGGLARARLHEIYAADRDDAGSAAGFALLLGHVARPAGADLLWLRTAAAQRAAPLYAPGLAELGVDPAGVVLGVVPDDVALLQCAADGARCAALGALVIEAWGAAPRIDLTASRRLALACEASGVTALLLRVGAAVVPSAAETRWQVAAAASAALPANAPGGSAFAVELLRRRAGPAGQRWQLEWDRDRNAFDDATRFGQQTRFGEPDRAPLPRGVVSVAGGGPLADREPYRRSA
jgi:protein ImuA